MWIGGRRNPAFSTMVYEWPSGRNMTTDNRYWIEPLATVLADSRRDCMSLRPYLERERPPRTGFKFPKEFRYEA